MEVLAIANSATVLSGGTSAPSAGTIETWSVAAAAWPVLASGNTMRVMDEADLGLLAGYEVMLVTANANGSTAAWTVTRGADGTTPKAHSADWTVLPVETPAGLDARYQQRPALNDGGGTVNVTGAATLDWNARDFFDRTMTGNTTFSFANVAPGDIKILTLRGAFAPSWPTVAWQPSAPTYVDNGTGMTYVFWVTETGEVRGLGLNSAAWPLILDNNYTFRVPNTLNTAAVLVQFVAGRSNGNTGIAVFDSTGAPIFTIGPTGGPVVYGDRMQAAAGVFGPWISLDATVNPPAILGPSSTYGAGQRVYLWPGTPAAGWVSGTTNVNDKWTNFLTGETYRCVVSGGGTTAGTWVADTPPTHTVTVASNAGTVPVLSSDNKFTNSSAATMAITMATAGAVDGQRCRVRVYDFSAAAQTIGWTNTENSGVSVPTTSNGSTTLPKTVDFAFNGATSKWRCVGST